MRKRLLYQITVVDEWVRGLFSVYGCLMARLDHSATRLAILFHCTKFSHFRFRLLLLRMIHCSMHCVNFTIYFLTSQLLVLFNFSLVHFSYCSVFTFCSIFHCALLVLFNFLQCWTLNLKQIQVDFVSIFSKI